MIGTKFKPWMVDQIGGPQQENHKPPVALRLCAANPNWTIRVTYRATVCVLPIISLLCLVAQFYWVRGQCTVHISKGRAPIAKNHRDQPPCLATSMCNKTQTSPQNCDVFGSELPIRLFVMQKRSPAPVIYAGTLFRGEVGTSRPSRDSPQNKLLNARDKVVPRTHQLIPSSNKSFPWTTDHFLIALCAP